MVGRGVVGLVTGVVARAQARGQFIALEIVVGEVFEVLEEIENPAHRAELVDQLVALKLGMAGLCAKAFGRRGTAIVSGCVEDARVAEVIADLERARAARTRRVRSDWLEVEQVAGGLLDRLAEPALVDHARRAELYGDLWVAVSRLRGAAQGGVVLARIKRSHERLADESPHTTVVHRARGSR